MYEPKTSDSLQKKLEKMIDRKIWMQTGARARRSRQQWRKI